jgi:hypothetical protein
MLINALQRFESFIGWPLFLFGIAIAFTSCDSAKVTNVSIHSENDWFRTTIQLSKSDNDSTGGNKLRELVRGDLNNTIADYIKDGVDCIIECNYDTSEVYLVSKIKGFERMKVFLNSINNFKSEGKKQSIITVDLSHSSVSPNDSLLIKVKFMPEYVPHVTLSNSDEETTFFPKADEAPGIMAKKIRDDTYEFSYRKIGFKDLFSSSKASDFNPYNYYTVGMEFRYYSDAELAKKESASGIKGYFARVDTVFADYKLTRFNELIGVISGVIVIIGSVTAYRRAYRNRTR